MVEFNSFGPAVGRLGSDSGRGGKVEARSEPPLAPLTLTTDYRHIGEVGSKKKRKMRAGKEGKRERETKGEERKYKEL